MRHDAALASASSPAASTATSPKPESLGAVILKRPVALATSGKRAKAKKTEAAEAAPIAESPPPFIDPFEGLPLPQFHL